jgi:hypothetical protein
LHPESKIDGQAINFDIDEPESKLLAFNMQYNSHKKPLNEEVTPLNSESFP